MAGNSFGQLFRVITFGESHGTAIGLVIDGCPSQLIIDEKFIQYELERRKPGQSKITSQRKESDGFKILSGVFEGKTTGAPIAIIIENKDQRSEDYFHLADKYRPSHGDYTYHKKYEHYDYRGGGRYSARETVARVAAGAIAKLFLTKNNISVNAYVSQIGTLKTTKSYQELELDQTEKNIVRCPDISLANKMITLIQKTRKQGDTLGGMITCVVKGCPVGLGDPAFDKLNADLAKAQLSINAAKGFEIGSGFSGVSMKGSEHNDIFYNDSKIIRTKTNNSGGIQGGISNGEDIYFNVAFKPVSTIMKDQMTVDVYGNEVVLKGKGRHDPCVVPRAVPIVEAMTALVLADHFLRYKAMMQ